MIAACARRAARFRNNDTAGIQQRRQHQKAKEGRHTDLQSDTAKLIVNADNPLMNIGHLA